MPAGWGGRVGSSHGAADAARLVAGRRRAARARAGRGLARAAGRRRAETQGGGGRGRAGDLFRRRRGPRAAGQGGAAGSAGQARRFGEDMGGYAFRVSYTGTWGRRQTSTATARGARPGRRRGASPARGRPAGCRGTGRADGLHFCRDWCGGRVWRRAGAGWGHGQQGIADAERVAGREAGQVYAANDQVVAGDVVGDFQRVQHFGTDGGDLPAGDAVCRATTACRGTAPPGRCRAGRAGRGRVGGNQVLATESALRRCRPVQ